MAIAQLSQQVHRGLLIAPLKVALGHLRRCGVSQMRRVRIPGPSRPHLSPCPCGCGWVGTDRTTDLVYPGWSSLGFGGVLKAKAAAASAPHPHVVHHHWPLRDDKAELPHVPGRAAQGGRQGKAGRPQATRQASQTASSLTSPQRLPRSHRRGVSGQWPGAGAPTPSGHSPCPGSAGAGSSQC